MQNETQNKKQNKRQNETQKITLKLRNITKQSLVLLCHFLTLSIVNLLVFSGTSFAQETPIEEQATKNSANIESRVNAPRLINDTAVIVTDSPAILVSTKPTQFRLGKAKGAWLNLLTEHVSIFSSSAEAQALTPALIRKIEKDISSILATEGYFTPIIQLEKKKNDVVLVNIDAGDRTTIKEVIIRIVGTLNDEVHAGNVDALNRQTGLLKSWSLKQADAFRDNDWNKAKTDLMETLRSELYAGATLIDSRASVDAESHTAILELDIDSGAAYRFGDLQVQGLDRYPLWLIERFDPPRKGDYYSKERLLKFQNALQNSAYFSSVIFNVEPDIKKADTLPIEIILIERQTRDLGLSAGYSSSTGFRGEISYRDRNALNQVWDLRSALRLEQKRQLFYTDIYLPPTDKQKLDSFGVLADRLDVENLVQTRTAFGVKRVTTLGLLEQRLGANYTQERVYEKNNIDAQLAFKKRSRALVGTIGWTWRSVDDIVAPRSGHRAQVDFAFANKSIVSDQSFFSVYGKYQYWIPLTSKDSLLLRTEVGQIFAANSDGIPENFLFRTGGSTTVRGYAYQSLGVKQGGAVTGGRAMGAASVEYIRWFDSSLGAAIFMDVGDAAKTWKEYRAKQGFGLGARIQTPAGPIALDLSYGRQTKKIRLDFSIAIAF
jgi:translocation and assembly module TamA